MTVYVILTYFIRRTYEKGKIMQSNKLLKKISTAFNKHLLGVVAEVQNPKSAPKTVGVSNQGFCSGFFSEFEIPETWILEYNLKMTVVSHYDLNTISKIELVKNRIGKGYDLKTKGRGHRNAPNSIVIARGITKEEGISFLEKYRFFGQENIKKRQEEHKKLFAKKVINVTKSV